MFVLYHIYSINKTRIIYRYALLCNQFLIINNSNSLEQQVLVMKIEIDQTD